MSAKDGIALSAAFASLESARHDVGLIVKHGFDSPSSQERFHMMVLRYTSYMRAVAQCKPAPTGVASSFVLTLCQLTGQKYRVLVTGNTLMHQVYTAVGSQASLGVMDFTLVHNGRFLEYDQTVEYYNLDDTDQVCISLVL